MTGWGIFVVVLAFVIGVIVGAGMVIVFAHKTARKLKSRYGGKPGERAIAFNTRIKNLRDMSESIDKPSKEMEEKGQLGMIQ